MPRYAVLLLACVYTARACETTFSDLSNVCYDCFDTPHRCPDDHVKFTSHCYSPVFRKDVDVCTLLEPKELHCKRGSWNRTIGDYEYIVAFKGTMYVDGGGVLRYDLLGMVNIHLGVYPVVRCSDFARHVHPNQMTKVRHMCYNTRLDYNAFDYCSMMENTLYALVPEGRQMASYRFLEVLCVGAMPILYTLARNISWPMPTVISEEMWLKCVLVKKRVHDILAIAYEAKFGNNGPIRERQIACERVSEIMCPAKHRHVLYHNELIRMGAIGSSTTGSIASTSRLLI
jgi:hypothetical protein